MTVGSIYRENEREIKVIMEDRATKLIKEVKIAK
jgi:hypothetical protein